ncbi:MAG: hypothetical protein ACWA6Y_12380 [Polaromonas sp.]
MKQPLYIASRLLILSCLAGLAGLAGAQTRSLDEQSASARALQREAIDAERSRLEADFLAQEAVCYKKFAVNNCLAKINTSRRKAMAELRRQEVQLNDEERSAKGAAQLRQIEEKSSPEKQQETAERRAKAAEDYRIRLAQEKIKQQQRATVQSHEEEMRKERSEKIQVHQDKEQTRLQRRTKDAEEAEKFNERQKQARERRTQQEAEQLKRGASSAKSLPLPE